MTDPTTTQAAAATDDAALGITIKRIFDAPRELVFDAWTQPARFAQWYGPDATSLEDVAMDVRPGGEWRARMILPDGNEIAWHGVYREVVAPERLVLTLSDRPGDEYELVTVVLSDVDGKTEMAFTQVGGHMDAAGYEHAKAGWNAFFDRLDAQVAA